MHSDRTRAQQDGGRSPRYIAFPGGAGGAWERGCASAMAIILCLLLARELSAQPTTTPARDVFVVEVLDAQTRRGVPLVELETIAHQRFVTDSAGRAAISEPDLLGRRVYFFVRSHGYQFDKDGFGLAGKTLEVEAGKQAMLTIQRLNLAERLYRCTGSGIYLDSTRAGLREPDAKQLPGDVVGCDSVMTAIYQDKLYWFWGDTNRPHYPLGGNFHITGATTPVNLKATIEKSPPEFEYFVDDQQAIRSVAKMTGDGPTWISAVTVLGTGNLKRPPPGGGGYGVSDNGGGGGTKPRMLANYVKVRNQMDAYRWGFVAWDDSSRQFVELNSTDKRPLMFPPSQVHTLIHPDQGDAYVYFCHPLPLTRVRANEAAFVDPSQYEGFTCLKAGTSIDDKQVERDAAGQLKFAWKRNTLPLTQKDEKTLIDGGLIKPEEARLILKDVQSDRRVQAHSGSVAWNKYRQRWVMIAVELGGQSSLLGDVWYAEADAPEGPWLTACKILSHDDYSFYNPKHHPYFDADDGRIIYFEGTYTTSFSGNKHPTPRYDYNQVMYRLDLAKVVQSSTKP